MYYNKLKYKCHVIDELVKNGRLGKDSREEGAWPSCPPVCGTRTIKLCSFDAPNRGSTRPRSLRVMSKAGADCGNPGPRTADHVWQRCFLDRYGRHAAQFSVRGRLVHGADYVVKDVCAICNAERMSPLDSYFCRLYDEYFVHLQDFNSTVTLHYDFDLLVRSLLKIAYNTARQGISDPGPLAAIRGFMVGRDARPMQLAIFAGNCIADNGSAIRRKQSQNHATNVSICTSPVSWPWR